MLSLADNKVVLAATDVTELLACSHLSQQRLAIARGERGKPRPSDDPHLELIRVRGMRHEAEQLEALTQVAGGAVDLSDEGPRDERSLRRAADRTEGAMREGHPLIYQATFFDGRWQGRTDFLLRVAGESALGEFHYEVLDTKLARRIKPATVHQLLLYSRLLADVQRRAPDRAHVILGDGARESIELRRFTALHRHVAGSLEELVEAPGLATYPEPVAHCEICALQWECLERRRRDDHLSLVAGASRTRRERLLDLGVATVSELAGAADVDPGRFGAESYELLRNQAALQVSSRTSGEPRHRHLPPGRAIGYAALPPASPGDLFFDLEGDPYASEGGIEYLWGWWRSGKGYEHRWAHGPDAERTALEVFVDTVIELRETYPELHVYHYAPHERAKLRSLSVRYATREAEVDELLRANVLVDLFAIVRHALQVGEESYSLKALERHHGFVREHLEVREGGGSIVAYEQWLESGANELLESIRAYNEEDCRSTLSLRDWLAEEMRPEAERELGIDFAGLARPEVEPEHEGPGWLPAVTELADRLGEGLPAEALEDDPEQARRRLLAHLLLYHHRESKPEWWRYFDLREMSLDDLYWERDAIAGITADPSEPPRERKASFEYAFRFPPQEHKLAVGSVHDPFSEQSFNLVELSEGRLVIRRGKRSGPPTPVALIAGSPVNPKPMREALVEVGEAVATGPSQPSAVIRLLDRTPPSLPAEALGESVEELIEAMLALDREVLPIQGPPGTGKTFRAARMIVAALASGLRVGISAPSHAAIQNLLREVEVVARDWPYEFRGVYRGPSGSTYRGPVGSIKCVSDNNAVNDEFELVASTAWLFARPEHRGRFDLLFIEEAGQYSLANAVAAGTCARDLVLLGDPQQLPQVTQAEHPFGSGSAALEHLLDGASTIQQGQGVLLTESWRMHPEVCSYVSERSYDDRLHSKAECAERRIESSGAVSGAGLRRVELAHEGRSQYSPEEAEAIGRACAELLDDGVVVDVDGDERPIEPGDIMVVAPYNLAVREIERKVPAGVRVGTVDRFQGQQAAVSFYALTCSAGEDVPRGLDFLFNQNRMNVAVSRAQCVAVLVYGRRLLDATCPRLATMELLDGICRFVEMAEPVEVPESSEG